MPRISLLRTFASVAVIGTLLVAGLAGFGQTASPSTIRVKGGDTLWGLSRRYGVTMTALASANHMKVSDLLLAGRTLDLPSHATGVGSTRTRTGAVAGPASATGATADAQRGERTFCTTYRPPTGPVGRLPAGLSSDPSRLALRRLFVKWARVYGVPVDLIEAEAWQESGWSNAAVSPAGAVGIGQLLPATAVFVNQQLGTTNLRLTVPSDNIQMMAAFLGHLLEATGGQICGAVASYYQGLGALRRYGVLPVSQTYVRNVLSLRPRFR